LIAGPKQQQAVFSRGRLSFQRPQIIAIRDARNCHISQKNSYIRLAGNLTPLLVVCCTTPGAINRNKVNAMLRIGIVLSVIWFVGFGGYTWFSSIRRLDDLYSLDIRTCSETFDITQNQIRYEDCIEEATELYHSRFNVYKERIPQLLAVDFGIIVFGWSVALFVIVITRLIRRVLK